jgi:hypothetical protein
MPTPENTPPGGEGPGRELSGVQRAGIVLGALAVLLIVFVVLQGGDDSGSPSSSSAPQTTATQTTTTESTATGSTSTEDSTTGSTTEDSTTGSTTDDNGSGGGGSDDDAGSETGATETQPSAPAMRTIRVVNGQPQGGVTRLKYTKGDRIRFKVQSDVADEIHVHGYDLKKDVTAGGSASFSFTASIEGRFEIELEEAGTQIAELEVEPS